MSSIQRAASRQPDLKEGAVKKPRRKILPRWLKIANKIIAYLLQLFLFITLPWLTPIIMVALMLRTIWLFNHFDLVYLMAFGGPMEATTTVPVLIHRAAFSEIRIGRAATISMFMVAILMVSTIL